jgi:hypothetical protein
MHPGCLAITRQDEGEEIGLHLTLGPGWCYGGPGFHELIEATLADLVAAARFIRPCDCEECSTAVR